MQFSERRYAAGRAAPREKFIVVPILYFEPHNAARRLLAKVTPVYRMQPAAIRAKKEVLSSERRQRHSTRSSIERSFVPLARKNSRESTHFDDRSFFLSKGTRYLPFTSRVRVAALITKSAAKISKRSAAGMHSRKYESE